MLYDLAKPHVNVRTNCRVVAMNPSIPSLTLQTGEVIHADLVIGADGVKSLARQYVIGKPDEPRPTGDAAYRAVIPTELLLADSQLKDLVNTPEMVGWLGPQRHIMGYNIVRLLNILSRRPSLNCYIVSVSGAKKNTTLSCAIQTVIQNYRTKQR